METEKIEFTDDDVNLAIAALGSYGADRGRLDTLDMASEALEHDPNAPSEIREQLARVREQQKRDSVIKAEKVILLMAKLVKLKQKIAVNDIFEVKE